MIRIVLSFLFSGCVFSALAQNPVDKQLEWYAKANPAAPIFVHFDKNVYSGNETAWFTAYLFGPLRDQHEVLCMSLIRDWDSSLVLQQKFITGRGLAFGQIQLPDSLAGGNYRFIAFTDHIYKGEPRAIFIQPVTIKTGHQLPLNARLVLEKPSDTLLNTAQLRLAVTSGDYRLLDKPVDVLYSYGNIQKKTRSDIAGQLVMQIPLNPSARDPNIHVQVSLRGDTDRVALPLIPPLRKAVVRFFPEGGHLIDGLPSVVAVEVQDQYGAPVATSGTLFEDQLPLLQFETNELGTGRFMLSCLKGKTYTVKLKHPQLRDSLFRLPPALEQGLALHAARAVVGDSLRIRIMSTETNELVFYLHNFRQSYLAAKHSMRGSAQNFVFPLHDVPEGLCALTITDSRGQPLAERMFYAHYRKPDRHLTLVSSKARYGKREQVSINIEPMHHVTDALVSVACVQANRLSAINHKDIRSHLALRDDLEDFPLTLNALQHSEQLEDILLIKGWRRYTWDKVRNSQAADTVVHRDSMVFAGSIKRGRKSLNKPVEIAHLAGKRFSQIQTDAAGRFFLKPFDLYVGSGQQAYLFVPGKTSEQYELSVTDPYQTLAVNYGKRYFAMPIPVAPMLEQENRSLSLSGNERSIVLKEVVIKKNRNDFFAGTRGVNACGDYVCQYNILNCPNHAGDPRLRQPIKGETYLTNGSRQVYQGCNDRPAGASSFKLNPVYQHKEFYVNTFTEPVDQAFWSTLYWNHALQLEAGKPRILKFFTGDITGPFKIVVQGISNAGVIYEEMEFEAGN
ncbi:hypothetical protein [Pedobacter sp. SYP-B3415]|uniref:hypothetical protein n=1 Tax=Pedobacter sp. SYP-B3415 TaxID=2496641 RepID=UPI00101D1605|nr:hypothetical protein [Pedobacter sp. SYP-B3415]